MAPGKPTLAKTIAFIKKLGGQFELNQANTAVIRVGLNNTKITDAELVHLKGLTELFFLVLADTQVTDAGLVHLEGLKNLRFLFLLDTKVTKAGVRRLQKALPNCTITH
ncbi:MAG: hypothetical protein GY888_25940 [Planctomycetaceae bacterium]|nr:hypothetical protein [Planctomycetaceae bacterium]